MILTDKNRRKNITTHDRYGVIYIKNFYIMPEPKGWNVSVQRWSSDNMKVESKHLKHIDR